MMATGRVSCRLKMFSYILRSSVICPEERKAALFALILKNQKQLQDLMPHYEPQIESFAWNNWKRKYQ